MLAVHAEEADLLGNAVATLMRTTPKPFFVQVGGFDGVSFDPLRQQIVDKDLAGLIVEPIPQYFDQLKSLYAGSTSVTPINCAISEDNGERVIWRFNPLAVERGLLPPHFAGISSFVMEDLLKDSGVLGRSSPNAETTAALRALLQPVTVQCRTMDTLLAEHGVQKVDILQIDTEGYDFIILKLFDLAKYRPGIIHYEHQHLSPADREAAETLLRSHGYAIQRNLYDTLAVRDATRQAAPSQLTALRELAVGLKNDGRSEDALLLLQHLASVYPGDAETLKQLLGMFSAQGRTLEALETLVAFKSVATDVEALLAEIRRQLNPAIEIFNRHLAAGEITEAEKFAAVLTAIVPRNTAFLSAALSCNVALGRKAKAAGYAATLLSLEPDHAAARALIAELPKPAAAPTDEIEVRIARATAPGSDLHPLIRLRDMHDVASTILCNPLTDQGTGQVKQLIAASRRLEINAPAGSEWEGWEKHYRLMLEAIDLDAVHGETPNAAPEPKLALMSAAGDALTWSELKASAKRLGAKAVFFAAADRTYVDLYARWYISSILKHSDVPCLVVVHVIGGSKDLKGVAKSLGIKDKRLIFSGDAFDAAAVTTKCYDAPPKGISDKPIAHFQSVRFLRLGTLLKNLDLPVFVSDIDLLLQRGVADLIERCAEDDIVLNENSGSTHAGSRLTANLLLVNPTDHAGRFLRFLRANLERALSGPEVSRWIDQLGLLLARHHLWLQKDARIGYFDTNTDINNVMYPSYQQNPFRFLSLFHGFDTSSLETALSAPEKPKPVRKAKAAAPAKRRAGSPGQRKR
jgi:FkbM family methyltransferase